ncbi:MAG: MGMT family protein [Alphaproteobacteria bacterium]|nr:MGMT family protein [Alphaproteobacteria bacterium]
MTKPHAHRPSTDFETRVYRIVSAIPAGRVMTYGQVAARIGRPAAARAVGQALHRNPDPPRIPCHRVVDARGGLSQSFAFGGKTAQARLLRAEGVRIRAGRVYPSSPR